MSYQNLQERGILPKISCELSILPTLSHPNVIEFHEAFLDDDDLIFIVTEHCTEGDLLSWITENRLVDKTTQKRVFRDICRGIQYLHKNGIAHNDIKPENVIIDCTGTAKLIDFGYGKNEMIVGDEDKSGTLMYAVPELFLRGRYHTQKADIGSLGILLAIIANGRFPFIGDDDRKIWRGELRLPLGMEPKTEALIH
jgi:serine/threonine protein kinase